MEEGNSLRDEVKDAICGYLEKERCEERSAVYEEACALSVVVFDVMGVPEKVQGQPYSKCSVAAERKKLTFVDLVAEPRASVKLIAQFLEDLVRKEDEESKVFPSLERMPKDGSTWYGWVGSAEELHQRLKEELL